MNKVMYSWQCAINLVETGKNIRRYRLMRGLSVQDVSDFFGGLDRNSIYKWERGETLPSVDHLYALAWLLGVSLDVLVVGNRESLDCCDDDQPVELIPYVLLRTNMRTHVRSFFVTYRISDMPIDVL